MLKLFDLPISSYCCKTRILLRHKNLEWHNVKPPDGYGSKAYCKIVPAGTIPALDNNGFIICDSEAIAEYINETIPNPPMLPDNPEGRAEARALSRFHDTRIEPVLRAYFNQVSPSNRITSFIKENASLLQNRIMQLSQMINPQPFLFGPNLSIADCGFAPSFVILDRLKTLLGFSIHLPKNLRNYEKALTNHPSVNHELCLYYETLESWIKTKQNG